MKVRDDNYFVSDCLHFMSLTLDLLAFGWLLALTTLSIYMIAEQQTLQPPHFD